MAFKIEVEPSAAAAAALNEPATLAVSEPQAQPARHQQLARALGWFRVGLGLGELLMPRSLCRSIGVRADTRLVRALGLRELASGIATLAQSRPGPLALQARVAGDVIDLGLLASAWNRRGTDRTRLMTGAAAVLGVTALDVLCARKLRGEVNPSPLIVHASIAVQRSPRELYAFWRDLSNLPRVLSHVRTVEVCEGGQFRIEAKPVLGRSLSWDARITEDVPGRSIAWRSSDGAVVANRGRVTFKPLQKDRGTVVSLWLKFEPSTSSLAQPLARMLGDTPDVMLKTELRRFKQWIETGELATTQGQPAGRRSLASRHLP